MSQSALILTMRTLRLSLALCLTVAALNAQEFVPSLRWMGDFRVRSEIDMRDFNQRTPANTYTLLRTRLALEALPAEHIRVLIQARDSRVFGQIPTLRDAKNLDLHQGYVEVKQLFARELTLRLGRQELLLGNERLVGPVGWHNVGRTFDGGLVKLDFASASVEVFAMNTEEVQFYTPVATPSGVVSIRDSGSDFYGANLTVKNIDNIRIDGYFLYQTNRDITGSGEPELERYTIGSYVKGKASATSYDLELAYQGGKRRGDGVAAYLIAGNLGYSLEDCVLSWVGLGYEILSGTPSADPKFKSFDPMYATGHKFHGFMDYFIDIPAHTGNRGLHNAIARATFAWSDKVSTNLWLHNFALARQENTSKALGQEIDIVTQYRYDRNLSFEVGVSSFIPARLMRDKFSGNDAAFWGYLATMINF